VTNHSLADYVIIDWSSETCLIFILWVMYGSSVTQQYELKVLRNKLLVHKIAKRFMSCLHLPTVGGRLAAER
jgi:hypothetical protein